MKLETAEQINPLVDEIGDFMDEIRLSDHDGGNFLMLILILIWGDLYEEGHPMTVEKLNELMEEALITSRRGS